MSDQPVADITPRKRRASFLWFVTVLAAIAVAVVLVGRHATDRGPRIRIEFQDAAGLQPGAELIHRGTQVGVVRTVELSSDLQSVIVTADLAHHAAGLAIEGTRFWIVQPEVSLNRVSGLDTLLGPRYIAVHSADEPGDARRRFEGLAEPPKDIGAPGFLVRLRARSSGSLAQGSAVLYRGMRIGRVNAVALAPDTSAVLIEATIEPRFAPLVRENTRFWDAGGVDARFSLAGGLRVQADSVESLISGAIGMATPNKPGDRVGEGHEFDLEPKADTDWLDWKPSIPLDNDPPPDGG